MGTWPNAVSQMGERCGARRATQSRMASRRFIRKNSVTNMRAVVQRVSRARVIVDGSVTGEIADGLVVLLGVGRDDTSAVATGMAEKISNLRIFEDDQRKMNRSL